ncbi:MAG: arginine--tRNA ligase [Ignavibacteria bacterium]|nr:arginine--tRNA ligase [Ignavibacteria bacterium]
MKHYLQEKVADALKSLGYPSDVAIAFEKPKQDIHGDLTSNVALALARSVGKNPRTIAQDIVRVIDVESEHIAKVEIAGPGFINFFLSKEFYQGHLPDILRQSESYGRSTVGGRKKTQVEFVSANPTGPLSVGHGRQAALGDTLANLLEWIGYDVTREYYYNNAGRQMRRLAESTFARYQQLFDPAAPFPEDGYQGDYIREIAERVRDRFKGSLLHADREETLETCKRFAENILFEDIKLVLKRLGIIFDVFFNEDSLYKDGTIDEVVKDFRAKGLAYDRDGAVWFRGSSLGLDQDRVIIKSTGEPTYRLPDIAYHRDKFRRGFDLIVDVFGADHIATIPDVLAGVKALGFDAEKVNVIIHQFVTLMRDGEQVKMSKRAATFVTLDELIDEVGPDAVRFFFLMRASSSHLEFDLNLAKEQSEKNPVYYLQYAHARIASILRFAESEGISAEAADPLRIKDRTHHLTGAAELALLKLLLEFPDIVESSALSYEPHRLTSYLHDVATAFHRFYHEHRVVIPERDLALARIALCRASMIVLANGLKILGVSAPERM